MGAADTAAVNEGAREGALFAPARYHRRLLAYTATYSGFLLVAAAVALVDGRVG